MASHHHVRSGHRVFLYLDAEAIKMSNENHLVNWDREKLERFKKAYADTKGFDRHYVFNFDGHDYVKAYAKHLIEYLEGELPK